MTSVEDLLRSTLEALPEPPQSICGPALRRLAHRQRLRARLGGVAVLTAVGATVTAVVPQLLAKRESESAAVVEPACMRPSTFGAQLPNPAPVPPRAWNPPGDLVREPIVQNIAAFVAAHDCGWRWPTTGERDEVLDPSTARLVYAGFADIDPSPRALVVVAGETAGVDPRPALAVLTTIAGGRDNNQFESLTILGLHESTSREALAGVDGSVTDDNSQVAWLVANGGVTSGTCVYDTFTDPRIEDVQTTPLTIKNGVGTCPANFGRLWKMRISRITAVSGDKTVWDAAPVKLR